MLSLVSYLSGSCILINQMVIQSSENGYNSKLRATLFIGHRYWPLCVAEGIRYKFDFLFGENPRNFELHPLKIQL